MGEKVTSILKLSYDKSNYGINPQETVPFSESIRKKMQVPQKYVHFIGYSKSEVTEPIIACLKQLEAKSVGNKIVLSSPNTCHGMTEKFEADQQVSKNFSYNLLDCIKNFENRICAFTEIVTKAAGRIIVDKSSSTSPIYQSLQEDPYSSINDAKVSEFKYRSQSDAINSFKKEMPQEFYSHTFHPQSRSYNIITGSMKIKQIPPKLEYIVHIFNWDLRSPK